MKQKKLHIKLIKLFAIIIAVFFFNFFNFCPNKTICNALDFNNSENNNSENDEILKNQFDESQANELANSVDDETKKDLNDLEINSPNLSQMKNFFKFLVSNVFQPA